MTDNEPYLTLSVRDASLFLLSFGLVFWLLAHAALNGFQIDGLAVEGFFVAAFILLFLWQRTQIVFFTDSVVILSLRGVHKWALADIERIVVHPDRYLGPRLTLCFKNGDDLSYKGRFGPTFFKSGQTIAIDVQEVLVRTESAVKVTLV